LLLLNIVINNIEHITRQAIVHEITQEMFHTMILQGRRSDTMTHVMISQWEYPLCATL